MVSKKNREKRNVWGLGFTSFFTDMSSEMIFPILPVFLTSVLNANMAIVGIIEGIAESSSAILKLISGWLSDRFDKKKPLVIGGYSISTLTKPLLAVASHWTHVLAVRFFDRVGKGIRDSPRDSLLAASMSKKKRGRGFGLQRALDTSGAVAGTLIAFFLLQRYLGEAYRLIFWLSAIPGIIAVLILWFFVKEAKDHTEERVKLGFKQFNPNLKRFLIIIGLFNLANFSYAFFILRAENIGIALSFLPLVYLVYNIVYAALSYPAGRISDRIGKKKVLSSGMVLFGLTAIGFAYYATDVSIWILFGLYGLFMAITEGIGRAFVSDLAVKQRRGMALGTYHMLVGITVLPANFIGGVLWNQINVQTPFIYAAAVAGISALLLIFLVKER